MSNDYIQQRLQQKQTGVKQPSAKKNYRGLAPVSLQRQEKMKTYFELRAAYLAKHPICECGRGCGLRPTDIHHTRGRGINFLNEKTWKALARKCHRWATDNPTEAKKLGL